MGNSRVKVWPPRSRSVQDDWLAWMPAEKDGVFEAIRADFDTANSMLSVSLNDAFRQREEGALGQAQNQAALLPDLFDRLGLRVRAILGGLEQYNRHFGTLPNTAAVNPDFFRGATAQRTAWRSQLLAVVLFAERSRFFHKLHTLAEIVEDAQQEFRAAAEEIAEGASVNPTAHWQALEVLHYDLNTCLCESIVLLKSFLCALPNAELTAFQQELQAGISRPPKSRVSQHW